MRGQVEIYSHIAESDTALGIIRAASLMGCDELLVKINSEGGSVDPALRIADALRAARTSMRVVALIEGACESAALLVACACERTIAYPDARFLVHKVCASASGDPEHMARVANLAVVAQGTIVTAIRDRTSLPRAKVVWLMNEGAPFGAEMARTLRLVDVVIDETTPAQAVEDAFAFLRAEDQRRAQLRRPAR